MPLVKDHDVFGDGDDGPAVGAEPLLDLGAVLTGEGLDLCPDRELRDRQTAPQAAHRGGELGDAGRIEVGLNRNGHGRLPPERGFRPSELGGHRRSSLHHSSALGQFQALQHRVVDMCLEIEQARSAVMLAAGKLGAPRAERERALSAAKNLVGRVGRLVAEESIQLHGGIAMTWDYALPHFAKRLIMIDHQLGDADHHLERFIAFSRIA